MNVWENWLDYSAKFRNQDGITLLYEFRWGYLWKIISYEFREKKKPE